MEHAKLADVANNAVDKLDARFGEILDKMGVTAQYLWPKLCKFVVYEWISHAIIALILIVSSFVLLLKGVNRIKELRSKDSSWAMCDDGPPAIIVIGFIALFFTVIETCNVLMNAWIPFVPEVAALEAIVHMVTK
jgi:hypothetical protein